MTVAIVEAAGGGAEREVGSLSLRNLPFLARERRADQWTMAPVIDGAVIGVVFSLLVV
jgi:tetrahydromethanopterin S-methyltransferase subunit F